MKKLCLLAAILLVSTFAKAQFTETIEPAQERFATNIGVFFGGGSLVGTDLEIMATNRFGVQLGVGLIGYGAGLNLHLRPTIRSPYLSLQYYNQGTGASLTNRAVAVNYVYRGRKWFAFQVGLAKTLEKGPAWPSTMQYPDVMLTYALGFYLGF